MSYVTKPVEVDAWEFSGTRMSAAVIAEALGAKEFTYDGEPIEDTRARASFVVDFLGAVSVREGDWIVRWPVRPDGDEHLATYSRDQFIGQFDEKPTNG